jgi:hypothetical protein
MARATLKDVMDTLSADDRRHVEARAQELIAEEMTLRDLRKALGRTQARIAKQTGKPQAVISRMERQSDMLISTLDHFIGALGGRLRLIAELPNRRTVCLSGFGDIAVTRPRQITKRKGRAGRQRSGPKSVAG